MKPSPIGIYARGVAMGAADVVPGVSGGTVALITGIYARLLGALVNIDKQAVILLFSGRWRALWYRLDGPFLSLAVCGYPDGDLFTGLGHSLVAATLPSALMVFFLGSHSRQWRIIITQRGFA